MMQNDKKYTTQQSPTISLNFQYGLTVSMGFIMHPTLLNITEHY